MEFEFGKLKFHLKLKFDKLEFQKCATLLNKVKLEFDKLEFQKCATLLNKFGQVLFNKFFLKLYYIGNFSQFGTSDLVSIKPQYFHPNTETGKSSHLPHVKKLNIKDTIHWIQH